MERKFFILILLCFAQLGCFCQGKVEASDKLQIEQTIKSFLNWHKISPADTSRPAYSLYKRGFPDNSTRQRVDMEHVERYLSYLKNSNFFSSAFISDRRGFFIEIDKILDHAPKTTDLVKVPGMDSDWILNSMEPDDILDHINDGKVDQINVIGNKAIARFWISKYVSYLFTLTHLEGKWLIDSIGYNNK